MREVRLSFNFFHDLENEKWALQMLNIFETFQIEIGKMGFYEPLRTEFSNDTFLKMWTEGNDDFYSFICRLKNSKGYLNIHNLKDGLPGNVGFVFVISKTTFLNEKDKWIRLFDRICREWGPFQASISRRIEEREDLMYETGFSKVKEVEWLNYWSDELLYVNSVSIPNEVEDYNCYDGVAFNKGYVFQLMNLIDDPSYYQLSEMIKAMIGPNFFYKCSEDLDLLDFL
ncbi:hypothetical protein [Exiguobacterium sp. s131]|uniref:hypothetical protein n=1 Tax=Exiguobacterium sp. s131 TaxID=2751278 RepID=UPI001BEA2C3F|nr:hypothetical protein [Exiguobacterium sp. s131]